MWTARINVPRFDAFSWPTEYSKPGPPNGEYDLEVYGEDEPRDTRPAEAGLALAERIIAAPERLVNLVKQALWDDFTGVGPKSGMWWHGNLEMMAEPLAYVDLPLPTGPDHLLTMMRLSGLVVDEYPQFGGPIALLNFWAGFDPEHDLGMLTDGERILGIGFMSDVEPFESD